MEDIDENFIIFAIPVNYFLINITSKNWGLVITKFLSLHFIILVTLHHYHLYFIRIYSLPALNPHFQKPLT